MIIAALTVLQLAFFLDGRSGQNEAQATTIAIRDHCLPHATGGVSGVEIAAVYSNDPPSRLRQPLDTVVPLRWDGHRTIQVPASDGQVWVTEFDDGRCMVRSWGNVLVPVTTAIHALFGATPWQERSEGGYTATFAPKKGKPRTVIARIAAENVDSTDVQGDAVVLITPLDYDGSMDGQPTFRTRHP